LRTSNSVTDPVKSATLLIAVAGTLTFAFLGATQALYGPLLPELQSNFSVGATAGGLLFAAHGFGELLGIFTPTLFGTRALSRHWSSIASGLILAGAAALTVAPTWTTVLAAAFVLAVGFGIHIVRLNSQFVTSFGPRRMAMSQLLNAAFSIGSIVGPVIVGLSLVSPKALFGGVAIFALALLPLSVLVDRTAHRISAATADDALSLEAQVPSGLESQALLGGFVVLMCLVVGVESCISGWATTLALAAGYSFASAANLTALFFGSIFVGRLLAAAFSRRLRAAPLVVGATAGIAALLAISSLPGAGPAVFVLTGLAVAPVFSATLVWLGHMLPSAHHANALVIAGAVLGSAVFPPLVGRVIDRFGPAAVPLAVLVIALGALVVAVGLYRAGRPQRTTVTEVGG
jgi:FHS family glucose/mannose:H+ symporter-like MFS transporter